MHSIFGPKVQGLFAPYFAYLPLEITFMLLEFPEFVQRPVAFLRLPQLTIRNPQHVEIFWRAYSNPDGILQYLDHAVPVPLRTTRSCDMKVSQIRLGIYGKGLT